MKFKSLKSQITIVFLTLISITQLAGLVPLDISIDRNAHASVEQDLQVGEKVFLNILENNAASLTLGAKILAADYGFRSAISSNDDETISSALNNHQTRINADVAIFFSAHDEKTITSDNLKHAEALGAVKKIISAYSPTNKSLEVEIFNGHPYQVVLVPIKAPLTIGWVLMGFKIDNTLAKKLNKLSNLEVTFMQHYPSGKWLPIASTFNAQDLAGFDAAFRKTTVNSMQKTDLQVGDKVYGSRILNLNHKGTLVVVLQRSITEATAQFETLRYTLFGLIVVGLAIFTVVTMYFSNIISSPISNLASVAKQFEQGNYDLVIESERKDEIGNLSQAFNSMRDAIVVREKKVARLAYWDEVTNLPNSAAFMTKLAETILASEKDNTAFTIFVINLDRFKQINNIMGRELGDALLKNVGQLIQNSINQETDFAARLDADEFAVVLKGKSQEASLAFVQQLLKWFEHPIQVGTQHVDVSAGVGIAYYPEHGQSDEQLLHHAEAALASAKKRKLSLVEYDATLDSNLQENLMLASELKFAIDNNQLSLYLQPKINIKTKQAYSTEALVRWIHPEKGFIFPDQFIPFAEQSGLIQKISLWMIEEACRVVAQMKEQSINLTIAVNISTKDLIDSDLPLKIAELLKTHQLTSQSISLEITESSIMDDPSRAEATLKNLAEMGLKIAIDDFGTGYSSLAYLKRLPVHKLKIDRSFVMSMEKDESDRKIVKSTIDLGHNLNLEVVAEGIENIQAWQLLEEMGCDYGQGYFMGKPMPVKDYINWLNQWNEKVNAWQTAA
jgi:diguanylate cyclase (GGDEF)-like protein